tara:strand:+ start:149 stop:547 length:399 start_codon:yes stop_codon:yes gene_type:complete
MIKLMTISEVARKLKLINPKTNQPLNHVLRFWEKEFKEIRPKKINNRRYYSSEQVMLIKNIKFLLKTKGMTISGAKKLIQTNVIKLDDNDKHGLKTDNYKYKLIIKSKKILEKINRIKFYGKKNSSKSTNGS